MPSIVDLAHLCEAAYQDGPGTVTVPPPPARSAPDLPAPACRLPGSRLLHDTNAVLQQPRPRVWRKAAFAYNQVGFYCASYTSDAESVLAFRGTDDFWDGLADDLVIAAGGVPPQVLAAFRTVSAWAAPGASYLTGHSLGGALAILSASRFNLPCVTFNAPGVADSCHLVAVGSLTNRERFLAEVGRCRGNPRVRNLRIAGDPVSSRFTTGPQAGGYVVTLGGASCGLDLLCRHGIQTCIDAVRAVPEYHQPLNL